MLPHPMVLHVLAGAQELESKGFLRGVAKLILIVVVIGVVLVVLVGFLLARMFRRRRRR